MLTSVPDLWVGYPLKVLLRVQGGRWLRIAKVCGSMKLLRMLMLTHYTLPSCLMPFAPWMWQGLCRPSRRVTSKFPYRLLRSLQFAARGL